MFKPHLLILIAITAGRLSAQAEETTESPAPAQAAGANAAAAVSVEPVPESEARGTQSPAPSDTVPGPVGESTPTDAPSEAPSQQEALANQLKPLLAEPTPAQTEAQAQDQLRQITDNASQLAQASDEGPLQLKALSIQMQSIHARIVEFPDSEEVDRLLSELRAAARQTKALAVDGAQAAGDFWLLIAELADMNRMNLPLEARREQSGQLMRDYLAKYPDAGPSGAVKASLVELEGEKAKPESHEDAPTGQAPPRSEEVKPLPAN